MLLVIPIACLLPSWGEAPAIAVAPKDHQDVRPAARYEVMQIKSGVEILVKRDGRETTVRLLGIDTPRISPSPKVDVLSQMQFLRGLIRVGDKVSLETEAGAKPDASGHLLARVRRASDGLWLNRDMIEQGFATAATMHPFTGQAEFAAAEQRAKDAERGMWASDFLDHAAQPARFRRVPKRTRVPFLLARRPGIVGGNDAARPTFSGGSNNNSNAEAVGQANSRALTQQENNLNDRLRDPGAENARSPTANRWSGLNSSFGFQNGGYTRGGIMGPFGGTVIPGAGTPSGFVHPGQSFGFVGGGYTSSSGGSSSPSSGSSSSSSSVSSGGSYSGGSSHSGGHHH